MCNLFKTVDFDVQRQPTDLRFFQCANDGISKLNAKVSTRVILV